MKQKKVAIYTIESDNYGNRLQNYALKRVLEELGFKVRTLRRRPYSFQRRIKDCIRAYIKRDKFTHFYLFNRLIDWDYNYITSNHIPENIGNKYDYFVIGSDQVWNPTFYFSSACDYLPFVDSSKCISYAASFGIESIPNEYTDTVINGLKHIKYISVREESASRIIKELTGSDSVVLIDPTMMLDRSDWLQIAKKPKKVDCDQPYILTYFIGGRPEYVNADLQRMTREYHWQVYNLLDMVQPNLYVTGPSEFVYLISRAQLVLTDSFHACVFSFLFGKPFIVYDRLGTESNMMSRMDTLLKKFSLERKYADNGLSNDILECDYQQGYKVLVAEREKAKSYLKTVMNIQ